MKDDLAQSLMVEFAESTGVSGEAKPRRYLWTDAFAVCNFLGLYRQTDDERFLGFARELVDQVHHILGRHRDDDPREGWISGLSDEEGERHPTLGGLRIGKKANERGPDEPLDPQREWDRDGQYFHYLTKWMHALLRISQETNEPAYLRQAAELAVTAQHAFTYEAAPSGSKRMFWKMSIDLRRPLVPSMGQHDPLDGLITCLELQEAQTAGEDNGPDLTSAIDDLTEMCRAARWATDDPLGIGGLLDDAARLARLVFDHRLERRDLLHRLLHEAEQSLQSFAGGALLNRPAESRLAFRELGLSIGLKGLERTSDDVPSGHESAASIERILSQRPLAERIESFWSDPTNRTNQTWKEHQDINSVMLATSLAPAGYFA